MVSTNAFLCVRGSNDFTNLDANFEIPFGVRFAVVGWLHDKRPSSVLPYCCSKIPPAQPSSSTDLWYSIPRVSAMANSHVANHLSIVAAVGILVIDAWYPFATWYEMKLFETDSLKGLRYPSFWEGDYSHQRLALLSNLEAFFCSVSFRDTNAQRVIFSWY